jgi:hypothetical protein
MCRILALMNHDTCVILGHSVYQQDVSCAPGTQSVPFVHSNGSSCYDNAVREFIFHTLKTESVDFE